jgi:hypothetical protein
MRSKKDFITDSLHIFILVSLAFAQPMYVISKYAEFFVMRHSKPVDVISVVVIAFFLIPSVFLFFEFIAGVISYKLRKAIHYIFVAVLFIVISLILLKKNATALPGVVMLAGASASGVLLTLTYTRFEGIRKLLTIFFPAIVIFPYLFLFSSPVSKVILTENQHSITTTDFKAGIPVVLIVFDEFSSTTLMNEMHEIDSVRYPNFAKLAKEGIWFRNATTVSDSTPNAVPAILTGKYPKPYLLPAAIDFPDNIFTLLGNSYVMKVNETHTMLCPETLCERISQYFLKRISSMLSDLSIVGLHIVLPKDLTRELPAITQTWRDFSLKPKNTVKNDVDKKMKDSFNDRSGQFNAFLQSIADSQKGTFFFIHTMLPHVPYKYLPSGKTYVDTGLPGLTEKKWNNDSWAITLNYQRYLLQVGYVDTLLGRVISRLKTAGIYDESLIIVTADHGVSFKPGGYRRPLTEANYQDIMPVPLFVKAPGQPVGVISDRNIETVDIVPTIADVLNIDLPWEVDGHSMLDTSLPERGKKLIYFEHAKEKMSVDPSAIDIRYEGLKKVFELFGSGTKQDKLYTFAPNRELIGRTVDNLEINNNDDDMEFQINQANLFEDVELDSPLLPVHIMGSIILKNSNSGFPLNIAVSVNGVIKATSKTFQHERNEAKFSVIVPESSLQARRNKVEVFIVLKGGEQPQLVRVKDLSGITYRFDSSSLITSSDGVSFEVNQKKMTGSLDSMEMNDDYFTVTGWAADLQDSVIPDAIVIFVDDMFFYAGRSNSDRYDVIDVHKDQKLLHSGFRYRFPVKMFKNLSDSKVRVFALSNRGVASELFQPKKRVSWTYLFVKSEEEGEVILTPSGKSIPVRNNIMKGSLDVVTIRENSVFIAGWAADVKNSQIPGAIIIFIDGKFFFEGELNVKRPDVSKAFNDEKLKNSGFRYSFPLRRFHSEPAEVRFFAISKQNLASELKYPPDFRWSKKS